jgi:hypothetical protein
MMLVFLAKIRPWRAFRSGCMPRAFNLKLQFAVNARNFIAVN